MRSLLSILFLVIYLLSTSGVVIAKHFCGDELARVNLFAKANCCCEDEATTEDSDDGCCKDELKYAKLDISQLAKKNLVYNFNDTPVIIPDNSYSFTHLFVVSLNNTQKASKHNSAAFYERQLYLKYCKLVLYA